MKTIGVIANAQKDVGLELTAQIVEFLEQQGVSVLLDEQTAVGLSRDEFLCEANVDQCAFALVIGGDGTMLNALSALRGHLSVLGINLGRIGFLTDIDANDFRDSLKKVLEGSYTTESRMMVSLWDGNTLLGDALNEVAVKHITGAGTGEFKVYAGDELLAHYFADGIIIAAPTGSTAYSMSAGGPIVSPQCELMIIQPICSHSLNARSIIVSAGEELCIEFDNSESTVLLDGSIVETDKNKLIVRKSRRRAEFLHLSGYNFYRLLFYKIKEANYLRGGLS